MSNDSPVLHWAPPILSNEPGSFAHDTMTRRIGEVIQRVIDDNKDQLTEDALHDLAVLRDQANSNVESPTQLRCLLDCDDTAANVGSWNELINQAIGRGEDWLTAPWLFVEVLVYRYIVEASGWFKHEPTHRIDPFGRQKLAALAAARPTLDAVAAFEAPAKLPPGKLPAEIPGALSRALQWSLWGNKADLSLWPCDVDSAATKGGSDTVETATGSTVESTHAASDRGHTAILGARDRAGAGSDTDTATTVPATGSDATILSDDTRRFWSHLQGLPRGGVDNDGCRVDIVLDNAGLELVMDLVLTDYLLTSTLASVVTLHCKDHPFFVSDAMISDVKHTITAIAASDRRRTAEIGQRLESSLQARSLLLVSHPFWTSPHPYCDETYGCTRIPSDLRHDLSTADAVILKGDLNYRRLVGDRTWDPATEFASVVSSFPAPLLALRTCKSPTLVGVVDEQVKALDTSPHASTWLTDGSRGLMQFAVPPLPPMSRSPRLCLRRCPLDKLPASELLSGFMTDVRAMYGPMDDDRWPTANPSDTWQPNGSSVVLLRADTNVDTKRISMICEDPETQVCGYAVAGGALKQVPHEFRARIKIPSPLLYMPLLHVQSTANASQPASSQGVGASTEGSLGRATSTTASSSAGEIAEFKRFFVIPTARGQGIGRRLLEAIECEARGLGYMWAVMDVGDKQPEATRLYLSSGYVPIPDYNDNPYATVWLLKRLDEKQW